MVLTIHIPIKKEEKEKLQLASQKEKLKIAVFVRRIALLEAERILNKIGANS